jgi:hypothetical protein
MQFLWTLQEELHPSAKFSQPNPEKYNNKDCAIPSKATMLQARNAACNFVTHPKGRGGRYATTGMD